MTLGPARSEAEDVFPQAHTHVAYPWPDTQVRHTWNTSGLILLSSLARQDRSPWVRTYVYIHEVNLSSSWAHSVFSAAVPGSQSRQLLVPGCASPRGCSPIPVAGTDCGCVYACVHTPPSHPGPGQDSLGPTADPPPPLILALETHRCSHTQSCPHQLAPRSLHHSSAHPS